MLRKAIVIILGMLIVLTVAGCGKSIRRVYIRENVDLGFITKIAVLPLQNQTNDNYVAERVRNSVITQILARNMFDVVDRGLVDSALEEEAIQPGKPIDANTLKRLGQRLNVQALMLGSVDEAGEGRKGSFIYPKMTLTLRLVDSNAAMVLWQANGHRNGDSFFGRFLGLFENDPFENTDKLVSSLLRKIPK